MWTTTPWTLPGQRRAGGRPEGHLRARPCGRRGARAGRGAPGGGARRRGAPRCSSALSGSELVERFGSYEGPIFAAGDREPGPLPILADEFVTTEDGTGIVHLAPAFGEDDYRVAAASPQVPFDPAVAGSLYNPVRPDGTYDERVLSRPGASYGGRFVKDEQLTAGAAGGPAGARAGAEGRGLRARLPALLALGQRAHLLRQTVVVHLHLAPARRAAGGQRDRQLAPPARQARPLRGLAGQQRRLGALARALLGHAAAGVALPAGPRARDRLVRRAGRARRRRADRPPPPLRRRAHVPVRRAGRLRRARAGSRCAACRR